MGDTALFFQRNSRHAFGFRTDKHSASRVMCLYRKNLKLEAEVKETLLMMDRSFSETGKYEHQRHG
jgi:hypothetical protein